MYLFSIVFFLNCCLLTNSALSASGRKSYRKHNTETANVPNDPNVTDHSITVRSINVTVPKNCKFCVNNDTDCMVFDSDRCEYNIRMAIIAESERMDDKFEVNNTGVEKTDVEDIFEEMMEKAAADESFKECIPFVSQYTDCYTENFCTGCSVCTCLASGQWNCMMTQKCKPQHQVYMDHQVFNVLMDDLGADEPDVEDESYYLDPIIVEMEQSVQNVHRKKREIAADSVVNIPYIDTEHDITVSNNNADNNEDKNHFRDKVVIPETTVASSFNDTQNYLPQNNDNTTNTDDKHIDNDNGSKVIAETINNISLTNVTDNIAQYNITINKYNDSHISDNKDIAGNTLIEVPFNNSTDHMKQSNDTSVYSDIENHNSYERETSTDITNNTNFNITQEGNKIQTNSLAINGNDEGHYSHKREISTDTTVTAPINETNINVTQNKNTDVNPTAYVNQNETNKENNYSPTTIENLISSNYSKMIPNENVEDIKEFVLYPISEIVKEKQTELNELVTIKDNLLNLLALCKKFFDANNGSTSNLSSQDNSQAFINLYNSKILPEMKKEMSYREDSDGVRKEDKLKDDLQKLIKDMIHFQKHNSETIPEDMKSVIRGLKYYSLEFMKLDQQHKVKDKPYSKIETYPQYRPKHQRRVNSYVLKALQNIFETLNNANDTNLTFKSVSSSPRKVLKRIINFNYHLYAPPQVKSSVPNENVIMTALLNIESVCIKYLNEHKDHNSELYKLKNINYIFARNLAILSEIVAIIDLPRFEDYTLSDLFAHRLQIVSDRIVEFLITLKMRKIALDVETKATSPMTNMNIKTSLSKANTRPKHSYPKPGLDTIIEGKEMVTESLMIVPINSNKNTITEEMKIETATLISNKDVTEPPNLTSLNNTMTQNPFNAVIEFLKKAKNEVTKFVQNQLEKIKNQRNKQTQNLKEKEKHYEEVMKKWQKKIGFGNKEKRSLKEVDRKISAAMSDMFTTVLNIFASQSHKLPSVMKTNH